MCTDPNIQETATQDHQIQLTTDLLLRVAKNDSNFVEKGYSPEVERMILVQYFNSLCDEDNELMESKRLVLQAYFNAPFLYPPLDQKGYPHEKVKKSILPPLVIDDFERFKRHSLKKDPFPVDPVCENSYERLGMFAYFTRDPDQIKAYMKEIVHLFASIPSHCIPVVFHHFRMNPILKGKLAEECLLQFDKMRGKYKRNQEYSFIRDILLDRVKGKGVGGY